MRKRSTVLLSSTFCKEICLTKDDFYQLNLTTSAIFYLTTSTSAYTPVKTNLQRLSLKDLLNQHR